MFGEGIMQLFSHIRIATRFIYVNLCFLACMHISFALGFGSMGQVSSSIGGAGVALKNSAWGIYYNPALLGADRRTKIGYSFGAQIQEQNLLEIATNIDGITKISSTLGDKLLGGAVAGGAVTINGQSVGGVFGNTLEKLFGTTNIDQSAIDEVAKDIGVSCNGAGSACNDLAALGTAIQNDKNGAAQTLQNKLVQAAKDAGAPPLLTGILQGIDVDNIGGLLTSISSGNVKFEDIIKEVGTIKIPKGADSDIDQLLSAFETMQKAIESNEVSIISQNGLVLQIGGRQPTRKIEADGIGEVTVQESDNGRGAVAIGILPQVFANISTQIDPTHSKLIVGIGAGCDIKTGNNCTFIEAKPGGDGLTLDVVNGGTGNGQSEYLSSSILTGKHTPYGVVLGLVEIPIAYGHTFYTRAGDINIGIAPKFILASAYRYNTPISFSETPNIKFDTNTMQMTQTFGLDLGLLYTPAFLPNLNIGLVAKNLNAPRINLSGSDGYVRLTQQLRAGVSYEMLNFLTLALDVDVLPNDTLSIANPKSQMVGGGILADFTFIDFRIGAMRDLYSKSGEGTILTTGVNLFGFLDVSVQYGLGKNVTLYGFNVSNYMALRVGGQFSF